jgi:hypothetical protein
MQDKARILLILAESWLNEQAENWLDEESDLQSSVPYYLTEPIIERPHRKFCYDYADKSSISKKVALYGSSICTSTKK